MVQHAKLQYNKLTSPHIKTGNKSLYLLHKHYTSNVMIANTMACSYHLHLSSVLGLMLKLFHTRFTIALLLVLTIGFAPFAGHASGSSKVLELSSQSTRTELTEYFDVLEDKEGLLSIQDVTSSATSGQFHGNNHPAESLNFGYTKSAYWLRLTLNNTQASSLERMLEINYPRLSQVQFYAPDASGTYQSIDTGITKPFASRPVKSRHFVFPLNIPAQSQQVVYLRISSSTALMVPARLWEPAAYYSHDRADYSTQTWYFGMVSAMLFFNLLLLFSLRDKVYLLYINFVILNAFTLASFNGLGKEFFWPDASTWSDISTYVGLSYTVVAAVQFMRSMLQTNTLTPTLDIGLKLMSGVFLLLPITFLVDYQAIAKYSAIVLGLATFALLTIGIYCSYQRQRNAYYFSIAFGIFGIGGVITALRALGYVPTNFYTANSLQIGSAIEMILMAFALADRFHEIRRDKAKYHSELLQAQHNLVDSLKNSEHLLEERVAERTAELKKANDELYSAFTDAENAKKELEIAKRQADVSSIFAEESRLIMEQAQRQAEVSQIFAEESRIMAEQAQRQAEVSHIFAEQLQEQSVNALKDLQKAQSQLVESEKMASLGVLVSNVAHEINTPIGAVKASGKNITDAIEHAVLSMPSLFRTLDQDTSDRFVGMLSNYSGDGYVLNTREERIQIKALTAQLEPYDLDNPRLKASILVQMGIRSITEEHLPLLLHPESDRILSTARSISTIITNSQNINNAVERVSKIVYALKAFSSASDDVEKVNARVHDGIEIVLALHQTHFEANVQLVRDFDMIPPLWCVQEDLKQAWNHLIQNALQAMNHMGTLTISIKLINNEAVVAISDTGSGIPAEFLPKIFDPFFTTRTSGEGSGLGLAIVQKIIDKHLGRISVHSEVGVGTTMTVFLPYPSENPSIQL